MSTSMELYNQSCHDLIASMTIKSEILADMTEELVGRLENDIAWYQKDKTLWRYYLNLSGEYHYLDTVMSVISLDTLQEIEFTKNNLVLHPNTKEAYQYGSTYYNDLIKRYPDQQQLINNILNPVDINQAIAADDFTILNWDKRFVESQEIFLISDLQNYIKKEIRMWGNRDYLTPSGHYGYVYTWQLFQKLPPRVKIIRLDYVHTNYAHSFHVWQFLESHCRLGKYKDTLTHKQTMYLYRNIIHIQNNAGKNYIFDELVEIFLTDRNIPIYQYIAKHNLTSLPGSLTPTVDMIRTEINYPVILSDGSNIETISEVMNKEVSLGLDNGRTLTEDIAKTEEDFTYSLSASINTRVLESELNDHNFVYDYTLTDWLLNEWIVRAHTGQYTTSLIIENPSNSDVYPLDTQEALILYYYTYFKSIGVDIEYIPIISTSINLGSNIPTVEELWSTLPNNTLDYWVPKTMLDQIPTVGYMNTTEEFYQKTESIYHRWMIHLHQYKILEQPSHQSLGELLLANIYSSYRIQLGDTTERINDWLTRYNIDLTNATQYDYETLAESIFMTATGADKYATISRSDIHDAMLSIVEQLSGYNIQIITVPAQEATFTLARKALKFGDIKIPTAVNRPYLPLGIKLNKIAVTTPPLLNGGLHLPIDLVFSSKSTLKVKNTILPIDQLPITQNYQMRNKNVVKSLRLTHGIGMNNFNIITIPKIPERVEITSTLNELEYQTNETLSAEVHYTNGAVDDFLDWRSSNVNIATIDELGNIYGVALGDVTFTAYSKKDETITDTITVSIVPRFVSITTEVNYPPIFIDIENTESLEVDEVRQLESRLMLVDGSVIERDGVTWAITGGNVPIYPEESEVATLSDTGVLTAISPGKITVTATSIEDSSIYKSLTINVNAEIIQVPRKIISGATTDGYIGFSDGTAGNTRRFGSVDNLDIVLPGESEDLRIGTFYLTSDRDIRWSLYVGDLNWLVRIRYKDQVSDWLEFDTGSRYRFKDYLKGGLKGTYTGEINYITDEILKDYHSNNLTEWDVIFEFTRKL